jgi:hypothetical protein
MPGSYEGLAVALLKLFRYFKWFHVTLLRDSLATTEYYWELYRATQSLAVLKEQSDFLIDGFSFTSPIGSITEALTLASRRSRGEKDPPSIDKLQAASYFLEYIGIAFSDPRIGSYFGGYKIAGKKVS